jgi:diguanylate cyclase (GGDEF)-like protein
VKLATALTYWVIVALWMMVLGTLVTLYLRNRQGFGTTRLLLAVVAIDTLRNVSENVYFGLFFGGEYGLFSPSVTAILSNPFLLILPKAANVGAGCVVLGVLLLRWLPAAVRERSDMERQATTDGMTGLWNRRQFIILTEVEWQRCRRYQRPMSLIILDIDQFKSINDLHGHDAGDQVIIRVAEVCSAKRRMSDIVARLGGEEFAVLLPETGLSDAQVFAERLRDAISNEIVRVANHRIAMTVSIGATDLSDATSIAELIKHADLALYEAKLSGRNRVSTFARASVLPASP